MTARDAAVIAGVAVATVWSTAHAQEVYRNSIATVVTHEFGVFMASNTKLGIGLGHTFADRLYVSGNVGVGSGRVRALGSTTLIYEEFAEAGLVLHPSRAIDILLAWRLGLAYFRFDTEIGGADLHAVTMAPVFRVDYAFRPRWKIQFAPFVLRGYWSRAWGTNLGVELALGYRF
jgi:hypothetical protein